MAEFDPYLPTPTAKFVPYFAYDTGKITAASRALFDASPKLYTLVILIRAGTIVQGEIFAQAEALPAAVKDAIPGWFADWIKFTQRYADYATISGAIIESGLEDPLADVVPGSVAHEFIVKPLLLGQLPNLTSPAAVKWADHNGRTSPWLPWKDVPGWDRFGPGADAGKVFSMINQINALGVDEDGWVSEGWYERYGQYLHTGFTAGAETLADGYGVLAEEWGAVAKEAADTFSAKAGSVGKFIKRAGGMLALAVMGIGLLVLATRGRR
jgi:hypothetical protein